MSESNTIISYRSVCELQRLGQSGYMTTRSSSARMAWSTCHPEGKCGRKADIFSFYLVLALFAADVATAGSSRADQAVCLAGSKRSKKRRDKTGGGASTNRSGTAGTLKIKLVATWNVIVLVQRQFTERNWGPALDHCCASDLSQCYIT